MIDCPKCGRAGEVYENRGMRPGLDDDHHLVECSLCKGKKYIRAEQAPAPPPNKEQLKQAMLNAIAAARWRVLEHRRLKRERRIRWHLKEQNENKSN